MELSTTTAYIGRSEDCDLQLLDNSVSRRHALLEKKDSHWYLQDLESRNGSFVEEQRIERQPVSSQQRIRIGDIRLLLLDGEPPSSNESSSSPSPATAKTEDSKDVDQASDTRTRKKTQKKSVSRDDSVPADVDIDKVRRMQSLFPRLTEQFATRIVGQREVLEQIATAIAANGHCLMIGLPGLAKTLMISTLGQIMQLAFKRIQFTPDLMPSDILGTEILDINEAGGEKSFRFVKGPVFTNLLLADEINRTPPKTQAALLESMQERQVTAANRTFTLPSPFFVLATQNPLEQEGTYPLPEAQLDRFMFNIIVDYPEQHEEEEIVLRTTADDQTEPRPLLSAEDIHDLQKAVRALPVSRYIIQYAAALVRATRPGNPEAPDFVREHIYCGAGPRATQFLVLGAKARAVIHGRVNISCEDVRSLAMPVMRHRIFTNFNADSEGITVDELLKQLINTVPEPEA